jgi:uncharacterized membrane protein YphA (DoxX/SURF4 family)
MPMTLPELAFLVDPALFLLRVCIAFLFASSGWSRASRPEKRSAGIGMSPAFTLVLGIVEIVGAVSLVLGMYPRFGAALLIGVTLGAIGNKAFIWRTGFWGERRYLDLSLLETQEVAQAAQPKDRGAPRRVLHTGRDLTAYLWPFL